MTGDRGGQASLCLDSDSGILHPDSREQSYPNVAGHHPAGRVPWVGDRPLKALQTDAQFYYYIFIFHSLMLEAK
jgi:hypothetical protein